MILSLLMANASLAAQGQILKEADQSQTVIRHFVAFKFKDGVSKEQIKKIDAAFLALQKKITFVVSISHGNNCSKENLNLGFDDGFTVTFKNENDRDTYITHAEHEKFKALALPSIEKVFVFDYADRHDPRPVEQIASKKIIDLSHVLGPNLPDFHLGNTAYEYKMLFTIPKDGYGDGAFTTPEHYGTHVDAPNHFYESGQTIDQIAAGKLILPCIVIDVRAEVKANSDYLLTVEKIKSFEEKGAIPPGCAVFMLTGFGEKFDRAQEYRNADNGGTMHFPAFGAAAANYLIKEKKAAVLGLDTLSADYGLSSDFPVHKTALKADLMLVENLANLDQLPARGATVFLGPLRIKNGTGSPARVLAVF